MLRSALAAGTLVLAALLGRPAAAELPEATALLTDLGFSADQIGKVEAGGMVDLDIRPSSDRELATAFAFRMPSAPKELLGQLRSGLVDKTDPNTIAFGVIQGAPSLDSFAKLTLQPDAEKRARAYVTASPGGDLNLSSAELATFGALGSGASTAAVEQAVRAALLARLKAYQAQGLAGIAPYARDGGKERAPADELRSATRATKRLETLVPAASALLLGYPASKPPGLEEAFRWSHYQAHGVPTIALVHTLFVPDGDAFVAVQRQFYVSGGYNCEQAIAALLPQKGGTLVVYTNRTSTDQVLGFGGAAKREIGSKLLASQLQALYKKLQKAP